jgi:hypothetical protein
VRYSWLDLLMILIAIALLIPLFVELVQSVMTALPN